MAYKCLGCYCLRYQSGWDQMLPWTVLVYNSAASEIIGMSPFEIYIRWQQKALLDLICVEKGSGTECERL